MELRASAFPARNVNSVTAASLTDASLSLVLFSTVDALV